MCELTAAVVTLQRMRGAGETQVGGNCLEGPQRIQGQLRGLVRHPQAIVQYFLSA